MHMSTWAVAPLLGAIALTVPAFQSGSTELSGAKSSDSAPIVLAQAGKDGNRGGGGAVSGGPRGGGGGGPAAAPGGGRGPSMSAVPSGRAPSAGPGPSGRSFSADRGPSRGAAGNTYSSRDRARGDVTVRSRDRIRDQGNVTVRNRDRGNTIVERGTRTQVNRTGRFEGDRPWRRGTRHVWGPGLVFYFYDGHYYGDCGWLRRRAEETGSGYWWDRYRLCRAGY